MMTKIYSVGAALAFVAVFGGVLFYYLSGFDYFINFEIGYFSTIFVLAATTFGYWQMVQGSSQSPPHYDLPDETERIDDRFGLWEEEPKEAKNAAEIFKEEKRRIKKGRRDFKTFLKTTKPALSIYRLAAYGVLVYFVFELISRGIFEPAAYLVGAAAAPMTAASVLWVTGRF